MASMVTFKVTGLKELGKAIERMNTKVQRKVIKAAVTAGARVIVKAARANAPVKTGALKKSIGSRRDILESKVGYEVRAVSVFRERVAYANTKENVRKGRVGKSYLQEAPTFYWKFNELGTVKQPAKPFIQPALSANIAPVTEAVKQKLIDGIFKFGG